MKLDKFFSKHSQQTQVPSDSQTEQFNQENEAESLQQQEEMSPQFCHQSHASEESTTAAPITSDPATWSNSERSIQFLRVNGIVQNIPCDLTVTKKVFSTKARYLPANCFRRKLKNGEYVDRNYLVYSKIKIAVFCAPCTLLGGQISALTTEGCNDWKNIERSLDIHETSINHKKLEIILKEELSSNSTLNIIMHSENQKEKIYWTEVLRRVIAVIKKLTSRSLPLRGSS